MCGGLAWPVGGRVSIVGPRRVARYDDVTEGTCRSMSPTRVGGSESDGAGYRAATLYEAVDSVVELAGRYLPPRSVEPRRSCGCAAPGGEGQSTTRMI